MNDGIKCGPHGARRARRCRELAGVRWRPSQGMRQDRVDCPGAGSERLGVLEVWRGEAGRLVRGVY